jgi:hypothetical protein
MLMHLKIKMIKSKQTQLQDLTKVTKKERILDKMLTVKTNLLMHLFLLMKVKIKESLLIRWRKRLMIRNIKQVLQVIYILIQLKYHFHQMMTRNKLKDNRKKLKSRRRIKLMNLATWCMIKIGWTFLELMRITLMMMPFIFMITLIKY